MQPKRSRTSAEQTAKASEEISGQITTIQTETSSAVESIRGIGNTIGSISETSESIAAAVEEQSAATTEIAANTEQVAAGTQQVSANIIEVNEAVEDTSKQSTKVLEAVCELTKLSSTLRNDVDSFLADIRAAYTDTRRSFDPRLKGTFVYRIIHKVPFPFHNRRLTSSFPNSTAWKPS